jgi:acyl-CoA thioester hydrolase
MNPEIPVEKIAALPFLYRATVQPGHIDVMGHMNIRHYLGFYDDAGWHFFASVGMDNTYYVENKAGGFALQHIIRYLAEVRLDETVAIHARIVARTDKLIHFMLFMINENTGKLASTLEALGAHADMTVRRTSPYPSHVTSKLDVLIAQHNALDWDAPVSGAIRLKRSDT